MKITRVSLANKQYNNVLMCLTNLYFSGNLVFGPGETSKDILIPILKSPNTGIGTFTINITEVMGPGQIGDVSSTEVTLEPVESEIYLKPNLPCFVGNAKSPLCSFNICI